MTTIRDRLLKAPCVGLQAGLWLAAASWSCVLGAEPTPASASAKPPASRSSRWTFSLLPKSLQRRPSLDFHVITEVTASGKKLTPPTPERPAYYLEQAGKFTQLGTNAVGNEHPPDVTELERAMQSALAAGSYRPAAPSTPLPRYVVVFNYGSFARFSTDADDFQQMVAVEQVYQGTIDPPPPFVPVDGDRSASSLLRLVMANPPDRTDVLQRAELIGGEKFAHDLNDTFEKEATYEQTYMGLGPVGDDQGSPFNRFMRANENLMNLVEDSFSSCYFVVASAFDYSAMKQGKKVLLWRTKMTVNSIGISMPESLPPLLAAAGPYFGKDMTDAVTITQRISREGHVKVGTPTVVDDNGAPVPNPPPPHGEKPKAP